MNLTTTHIVDAASMAAGRHAPGWTNGEVWLMLRLFDFNTLWIPVLLLITMVLVGGRRRPGRLLTVAFPSRGVRMRARVHELSVALGGASGIRLSQPAENMVAIRLIEQRRWNTVRRCLYGPSLLGSSIMLYGAIGGWGGKLQVWSLVAASIFLALSGAVAGVEAWSRRRADPYGNAVRCGVAALEALVYEDSAESRTRSLWLVLRGYDKRPTAYFSVDWTFRTAEAFCLSVEQLARHAVRGGDTVLRARRVRDARTLTAYVLEGLDAYCKAADARAAGNGSDSEVSAKRCQVLKLVSRSLEQLSRDRLIFPDLVWDDLPEDRRNTAPLSAGRRTFVHTGAAVLVLAAMAALFTWAGVPGAFISPVLFALGGIATILLPQARWPAQRGD